MGNKLWLVPAGLLLAGCHSGSYDGVVQAPELNVGGAIAGLTLLAGLILVIRGSR